MFGPGGLDPHALRAQRVPSHRHYLHAVRSMIEYHEADEGEVLFGFAFKAQKQQLESIYADCLEDIVRIEASGRMQVQAAEATELQGIQWWAVQRLEAWGTDPHLRVLRRLVLLLQREEHERSVFVLPTVGFMVVDLFCRHCVERPSSRGSRVFNLGGRGVREKGSIDSTINQLL